MREEEREESGRRLAPHLRRAAAPVFAVLPPVPTRARPLLVRVVLSNMHHAYHTFLFPHTASLATARTDGDSGTSLATKIEARLASRRPKRVAVADADDGSSSGDDESDDRLPGETDDESSSDGEGGSDAASDDSGTAASDNDDDSDDAGSSDEEGDIDAPAAAAPTTPPSRRAAATAPSASVSDSDADDVADAATDRRASRASAAAAAAGGGGLFARVPEGTAFAAASFDALRLSRPLVKATAALGYARPTPIQVRWMERERGKDVSFFSSPHSRTMSHHNKLSLFLFGFPFAKSRCLNTTVLDGQVESF